jgi:hypothetical protein
MKWLSVMYAMSCFCMSFLETASSDDSCACGLNEGLSVFFLNRFYLLCIFWYWRKEFVEYSFTVLWTFCFCLFPFYFVLAVSRDTRFSDLSMESNNPDVVSATNLIVPSPPSLPPPNRPPIAPKPPIIPVGKLKLPGQSSGVSRGVLIVWNLCFPLFLPNHSVAYTLISSFINFRGSVRPDQPRPLWPFSSWRLCESLRVDLCAP